MAKIFPVIMCGGAGTRMWPLSRKSKPKQFHAIVTENSMLQETLLRLKQNIGLEVENPSFVCAASDEALIRAQCEETGIAPYKIILEPIGRNTAPVAAVISQIIGESDANGLILLLPADHHIADPQEFWICVEKGIQSAILGHLITLGIHAASPETGYGYIKAGGGIDASVYAVEAFVEKPDHETAISYLADGRYYWNAGIFLFSAIAMIRAFESHASDILTATKKAIEAAETSGDTVHLNPDAFAACRSDSIDYAIMEQAEKVAVIAPVNIGWSDIGSWAAVRDMAKDNNAAVGNVIALDCQNSFIRSDGPLVAAIGTNDLIIVATDGAVLVMPADRSQDVKQIVEQLKSTGKTDVL